MKFQEEKFIGIFKGQDRAYLGFCEKESDGSITFKSIKDIFKKTTILPDITKYYQEFPLFTLNGDAEMKLRIYPKDINGISAPDDIDLRSMSLLTQKQKELDNANLEVEDLRRELGLIKDKNKRMQAVIQDFEYHKQVKDKIIIPFREEEKR